MTKTVRTRHAPKYTPESVRLVKGLLAEVQGWPVNRLATLSRQSANDEAVARFGVQHHSRVAGALGIAPSEAE